MADPVLLFEAQLSHRLSILRKNKKRIVSKPPSSDFFEPDPSPAFSLDNRFPVVRRHNGNGTFESGSSFEGGTPSI